MHLIFPLVALNTGKVNDLKQHYEARSSSGLKWTLPKDFLLNYYAG